jgi:hypothetical protein
VTACSQLSGDLLGTLGGKVEVCTVWIRLNVAAVLVDQVFYGSMVVPLRTAGGYRRFTVMMLKDIASCCYRHGWFSMETLKSVYRQIVVVAHRDTGGYGLPR